MSSRAVHLDARIEALQASLEELRDEYPELEWRFTNRNRPQPVPPRWPPEIPKAPVKTSRRCGSAPSFSPMIRPVGYRCTSAHRSSPSYGFGRRIEMSRNVDPFLADQNPGPGHYNNDVHFAMARSPRGPRFSMGRKITLSRNVDPHLADDIPGPGAYDTDKY